jgi:hypothetical protein
VQQQVLFEAPAAAAAAHQLGGERLEVELDVVTGEFVEVLVRDRLRVPQTIRERVARSGSGPPDPCTPGMPIRPKYASRSGAGAVVTALPLAVMNPPENAPISSESCRRVGSHAAGMSFRGGAACVESAGVRESAMAGMNVLPRN